ncbi:hypothetical protein LTR94_038324, partial [Friedmanniomyces endolithicus]
LGLRRLADHRPDRRPHRRAPAVDPVRRPAAAAERRDPRKAGPGLFAQRRLEQLGHLSRLRLCLGHGPDAARGPAQA